MKNILTPICQAWLNEPATLKGAALPISPRFLGKYSLFFQKKSDTLQFPNCFVCCRRPSGPVVSRTTLDQNIYGIVF